MELQSKVGQRDTEGERDDSMGKGTYCQPWWHACYPWDPQDGRKKLTPVSWPDCHMCERYAPSPAPKINKCNKKKMQKEMIKLLI